MGMPDKPSDSALRAAYRALSDRARQAEDERDALHTENERLKLTTDWADIDELRAEIERLKAEQTQYPFNVAVSARAELREAQAEIERLRAVVSAARKSCQWDLDNNQGAYLGSLRSALDALERGEHELRDGSLSAEQIVANLRVRLSNSATWQGVVISDTDTFEQSNGA
jgi:chromosome segregation ATPase